MELNASLPEMVSGKIQDTIVVGAGFSGLYLIYKLRKAGFDVLGLESGSDVGGTWYWNRYPGARCDIESLQYSYSFDEDLQQEWEWTERFSTQPEILAYLNHVADRFDLRPHISFETTVKSAHYHEAANIWEVTTDSGDKLFARYLITAVGCLSAAREPEIKGRDAFGGTIYHTGDWPHGGVSVEGKRVAVIGTGSSGIQVIPEMAKRADHLYVFQRTPSFSIPARNQPLTAEKTQEWKQAYAELRKQAREETRSGTLYDFSTKSALEVSPEEREAIYQARWDKGGTNFGYSFTDLITNQEANDTAADFVRRQIHKIVKDQGTAETLTPYGYPIFAKRLCIDTDYYNTFNRDNVTLVDVRNSPIEEMTEKGIRTTTADYEIDVLIFATGFDAITGPLTTIDIRGRNGESLAEKWKEGPRTYLGLMSAGFPNLFMVTGPGSPSVMSNMVVSIEQHVDFITDCLDFLQTTGATSIEAQFEAENEWAVTVNKVASETLYAEVNSWYTGANIPGKPRVFMPYLGGVDTYRRICDEVAKDGYRGFDIGVSLERSEADAEVKSLRKAEA